MGFGTILKLKSFLSPQNLRLLDMVLRGLTDPSQASFQPFWAWFSKLPGVSTPHIEHACKSLGELRLIVRDYIAGKD